MLETDPGDESDAKGDVEKAFVGDGEDDKDGRKGQEDDDQSVEIVIDGLEAVQ